MNNLNKLNQSTDAESSDFSWKSLYKVAGIAAIIVVVVGLIEIAINFFPGGSRTSKTVIDWFALFQNNWFLGLRNLGLLNIIIIVLGIPTFLALYAAHRRVNKAYAALAVIISFIGVAVFLATNRAFPMLGLVLNTRLPPQMHKGLYLLQQHNLCFLLVKAILLVLSWDSFSEKLQG